MQVTLRLVVATMLMLTMALLAGSLANQQGDQTDEFSDSQTNYANCQLWQTRSSTLNDPGQSDKWETKYDENDCGGAEEADPPESSDGL